MCTALSIALSSTVPVSGETPRVLLEEAASFDDLPGYAPQRFSVPCRRVSTARWTAGCTALRATLRRFLTRRTVNR
jgi:hypothetical protein